ncbi:hypothetical protein KEM60_02151 [Austwickia sp. TVS 96-490-7B]|uniref:TetR/AcrR family transcriptional regulator n=1 Tax=Austwickia sp. TVS 96-490-7B TaxID=2830843 RepID=UPI001C588B94|nr:TetR/AcrR family transcriptional regulator [Austwickia sp. TVS 96-490-7B]MBW3085940.1 hypothetical protein [Austwickia sp. TVS 96-490-7B]
MRRTAELTAQTRLDILAAGLSVFARDGYGPTRLADVAALAGVTRGAVYHHFQDKRSLYDEVVDHYWMSLAEAPWEVFAIDAPLPHRLALFLDRWVKALRCDRQFRDVMSLTLHPTLSITDGLTVPTGTLMAWHARCEALFRRSSEPSWSEHAPDLAGHVLAWLCGTATVAALDPNLLPESTAQDFLLMIAPLVTTS